MKATAKSVFMTSLEKKWLLSNINKCKELLAVMSAENVELKNRLSHLLKSNPTRIPLEKAEEFHNRFLLEDERIYFLREVLRQLETTLLVMEEKKSPGLNDVTQRMDAASKSVYDAQKQFNCIRRDFDKSIIDFAG